MTAAVFSASYSDWKLIRTRGVVQLIFEVPINDADHAYQVVGGMPNAASERWFAIARLHEGGAPEPSTHAAEIDSSASASPRGEPSPDIRLVRQAGIACGDPQFQRFLFDHQMMKYAPEVGEPNNRELDAVTAVRLICGVTSRADILPGTPAAARWHELWSKFQAWKIKDAVVPA